MACFQGDGKSPPVSDILSMRVMNGATVDAHSLRSHVGRGSEAHCFEGDILMARMTSLTLTVVKVARSWVAHGVNIGGAAVVVAARTSAIFESMKS